MGVARKADVSARKKKVIDDEAEEGEESDGTQDTILDESEETEEATAEDIQCVFSFSFTLL